RRREAGTIGATRWSVHRAKPILIPGTRTVGLPVSPDVARRGFVSARSRGRADPFVRRSWGVGERIELGRRRVRARASGAACVASGSSSLAYREGSDRRAGGHAPSSLTEVDE